MQEVIDSKYDPNSRNSRHNNSNIKNNFHGSARERSKSAPLNSPKSKKLFKKSKKDSNAGAVELIQEDSSLFPNGKSLVKYIYINKITILNYFFIGGCPLMAS